MLNFFGLGLGCHIMQINGEMLQAQVLNDVFSHLLVCLMLECLLGVLWLLLLKGMLFIDVVKFCVIAEMEFDFCGAYIWE